jgi:hypothetical protein
VAILTVVLVIMLFPQVSLFIPNLVFGVAM